MIVPLWQIVVVVLWLLETGAAPAIAQQACSADSLGVSRVIEIETSNGKRLGEPLGDPNILSPGEVVLTFDDGPRPKSTRPILAALAAHCTKATFFSVGEVAAEFPEVVKEIVAQGHTLGTHTWSHANLRRQSVDRAKMQIETAFTAIERAAGAPIAPFFRFPYLSESETASAHLASRNIAMIAIDVDSFDWRSRDAGAIVRRIMSGLERRGRGIILMHDIHASTAVAVPALLTQLKQKGYRVVHLTSGAPAKTLTEFQPPEKNAPPQTGHERRHRLQPARTSSSAAIHQDDR